MRFEDVAPYRKKLQECKDKSWEQNTTCWEDIICQAYHLSEHGIGGKSYRGWVVGIMHKGVYLCVYGHSVCVYLSTVPAAKFIDGDENSCANGIPWPRSDDAELIPYNQAPEIAREKADKILPEIYAIITEVIEKECARLEAEIEQLRLEKEQKDKAIEDAWAAFEVEI